MRKWVIVLLLFISIDVLSQKMEVINLTQLQHKIQLNNDTLYVVNFWATWCKPCIEEMPYFENITTGNLFDKTKVLFVSLNSVKEIKAVKNFVVKNKLKSETVLLNGGNPNIWMNAIDSSWTGSIPATVFYRNEQKVGFHEGELTKKELENKIESYITSFKN